MREMELLRLMGWRRYVWLSLKMDRVQEWCERVYFCHHNARVLADMEYRLGCVLDEATGGRMSKAYYDVDTMYGEMRGHQERMRKIYIQDAIDDGEIMRVEE